MCDSNYHHPFAKLRFSRKIQWKNPSVLVLLETTLLLANRHTKQTAFIVTIYIQFPNEKVLIWSRAFKLAILPLSTSPPSPNTHTHIHTQRHFTLLHSLNLTLLSYAYHEKKKEEEEEDAILCQQFVKMNWTLCTVHFIFVTISFILLLSQLLTDCTATRRSSLARDCILKELWLSNLVHVQTLVCAQYTNTFTGFHLVPSFCRQPQTSGQWREAVKRIPVYCKAID